MRLLFIVLIVSAAAVARADVGTPVLPATLSLRDAIDLFNRYGLDALIADAAVASAEGDVTIAGAIPNPGLSVGYGRSFYSCSGSDCSAPIPPSYSIGISDSNAIEDSLSGKRRLRISVADAALKAARHTREDASRALLFQVKSQFEQVLVAQLSLKDAIDTASAQDGLLAKTQDQATAGKIGDADVLRVKVAKLEADQAIDQATQSLRKARAGLAYLLGVRAAVPEFNVVEPTLDHYGVPSKLASTTHDQLLAQAFASRPDLLAQQAQTESAEQAVALARRNRFPDIGLSLGYVQQGTDPSGPTPPTFTIGLSATLPVLYQQQGEIQKAQANLRTQQLTTEKLRTTIVNDFETAYADYLGSQSLIKRMDEGKLLDTAREAMKAVILARKLGAASLLDELTATATFIATQVEYESDLASYWTAVFELEHAVGSELR